MPKPEKSLGQTLNMTTVDAKLDKLTGSMAALMVAQDRTEQQISKGQQNTDASFKKIATFMGEIRGQVSQHSAEITGLKENVTQLTEELHDLRARIARVEDTGAT